MAAQYTSSYGNYTTVVYGGYEFGNRTLKEEPWYGAYDGHHRRLKLHAGRRHH